MAWWAWLVSSWLSLTLAYSRIARHEIGGLWALVIGLLAVPLLPLVVPFAVVVWLREQMSPTQPRARWAHSVF